MKFKTICIGLLSFASVFCRAQKPAADNPERFLQLFDGKVIGLVANHSALSGEKHLLDVLIDNNVNVKSIFAPEHGFRGTAGAGETVVGSKDEETGIPIISLFGNDKKPKPEQLKGIDCMIFDMQDAGTRFYTYLSTLHYVMEACAENEIELVLLDRPNPNGFYVDGPVLDTSKYRSFVGMHPIPIVHGMTLGELAMMINGEGWLRPGRLICDLTVVTCIDYTHDSRYRITTPPSPSLRDMQAIYLYPVLCLFEGTPVSVARGTDFPFKAFGHPSFKGVPEYDFAFIPASSDGKIRPLHEGKTCFGKDLRDIDTDLYVDKKINLEPIIEAYKNYKEKNKFFNKMFLLLTGVDSVKKQIIEGKTAEEIRQSWQPESDEFKTLRKKYLLYPDFE